MFDFIRTHQRLMQLVLLILILPSFALIGVSGYTNYVSGDHDLVEVGDTAITQQEFDEARRNQLQRMQASAGSAFDPSTLDTTQARTALLESLIQRRLIINEATQERFSVSDARLREAIASIPELWVDGRFSQERYTQVLASMGVSSRDFEQGQRAELALQRVLGPVGATVVVPPSVTQSVEQALTAQRSIRLQAFDAAAYADKVQVSDADIKAWYDANQNQLQVPEYVSADYLLLDESAAMQGLPEITESEMRAYYEQNKSRYVMPARVQVSHVLVQPEGDSDAQRQAALEKATALSAKLAADPAQFAEVAKAESDDAGTANDGGRLGWISKGSWPQALEEVVFALEKGAVSGAVEGPDGYHVFLAEDVQREAGETFEQAKAKVQSEIRRQLAADRYAEMATRLTDLAYEDQTSLQPAAQALGLQVRSADGIARDRLLDPSDVQGGNAAAQSNDALVLDDPRVRRALFASQSFTDKHNSGVIEISPGVLVVVRVNQIRPAHVLPLDKANEFIRQQLLAERSRDAARAAGQEALAVLKGKPAAPEADEAFGTLQTVSRVDSHGLAKPVLDAAFGVDASNLPAYVGVEGAQGYVIVRVEGAEAGRPDPMLQASLGVQIGQATGMAEESAVLSAMREAANVRVLPDADKALQPEGQPQG
ncbi:MAG TPA: SurA N-terminal domain-containing protein [Pusillimonas sp.]|uniref:SurA N-terminal domain-containing protein n=1 Tax=Pusillimonas sp. TaxID=3040095 RepID=UPI002C774BDB|nr:SurA N-terminal domain-containing protein [Pusillimonas sp.]HUH88871.1 SurA N-terminal domain-containing protein [Pusillimonas sp.]